MLHKVVSTFLRRKLAKRQNLLPYIPYCSDPTRWGELVSLIQKDKQLDLRADQEAQLAKLILQKKKELYAFRYSNPIFTFPGGTRKDIFVSLTEHAIVKAVAREMDVPLMRAILNEFFNNLQKNDNAFSSFMRDLRSGGNKVKIKVKGLVLVIAFNKSKGLTSGPVKDALRNPLRGELCKKGNKIVIPSGVNIRIRTMWGKNKTIGKPLSEEFVDEVYPACTYTEGVPYTTHSEAKDDINYDYKQRF